MRIEKINESKFRDFASSHPLRTYYQTPEYAMYMSEKGFDYEYVGMFNFSNNLVGASMILYKKIGMVAHYGYAPRGFLIDYRDSKLVETFIQLLSKFYHQRGFAFIKVNPDIAKNYYDKESKKFFPGPNWDISKVFINNKFHYLANSNDFQSVLPTYNAVVPLKDFSIKSVNTRAKNNILKNVKNGVSMIKGDRGSLQDIFPFVKNFGNRRFEDYQAYYDYFSKNGDIDCFLIKIDFSKGLELARKLYFKEEEVNEKLVDTLTYIKTMNVLDKKMKSDRLLNKYKEDVLFYSEGLARNKEQYIAGAITIKFQNRVYIISSGYDSKFKHLSPNYYMYYKLCEFYRDDFDFIDLNGFGGEVSEDNRYNGLNKFKLAFNPVCYETVGEMDLIINKFLYKRIMKKGTTSEEFKKKVIKKAC